MSMFSLFSWNSEDKDSYKIYYRKKFFIKINRKILISIHSAIGDFLHSHDSDKKVIEVAKELESVYQKEKKKYFNIDNVARIEPEQKEHFQKAARIIKRFKTDAKTFMQAQIHGLGFINSGKGTFPSPNQISTPNAETRLMSYLALDSNFQQGGEETVSLDQQDLKTPLSENGQYITFYFKIKENYATLKETMYVRQLQRKQLGKVDNVVEAYYEKLTGGKFG